MESLLTKPLKKELGIDLLLNNFFGRTKVGGITNYNPDDISDTRSPGIFNNSLIYWNKADNFRLFKKCSGLFVGVVELRKRSKYIVLAFDNEGLEYNSDMDGNFRNFNTPDSSEKAVKLADRICSYHSFFDKNEAVGNYQVVGRNLVINSKAGVFAFSETYFRPNQDKSDDFSKAIKYINSNGYSPETKSRLTEIVELNKGFFLTSLLK
jgi:hypothetical protein